MRERKTQAGETRIEELMQDMRAALRTVDADLAETRRHTGQTDGFGELELPLLRPALSLTQLCNQLPLLHACAERITFGPEQ